MSWSDDGDVVRLEDAAVETPATLVASAAGQAMIASGDLEYFGFPGQDVYVLHNRELQVNSGGELRVYNEHLHITRDPGISLDGSSGRIVIGAPGSEASPQAAVYCMSTAQNCVDIGEVEINGGTLYLAGRITTSQSITGAFGTIIGFGGEQNTVGDSWTASDLTVAGQRFRIQGDNFNFQLQRLKPLSDFKLQGTGSETVRIPQFAGLTIQLQSWGVLDLVDPAVDFKDVNLLNTGGSPVARALYSAEFRVVDAALALIPNARLYLQDSDSGDRLAAYSDNYELNLLAVDGTLTTEAVIAIAHGFSGGETDVFNDTRAPYEGVFVAYGYFASEFIQYTPPKLFGVQQILLAANTFLTEADPAVVAGYSTKASFTLADLYDYAQYLKTTELGAPHPSPREFVFDSADGAALTLNTYDLTIDAAAAGIAIDHSAGLVTIPALSAGGRFDALAISSALTLPAGDYSALAFTFNTGSAISLSGNTSLAGSTFNSATLDNTSAGTITVSVPVGAAANIALADPTTGGGAITLQEPVLTLQVTGIPDVTGNILYLEDLSDNSKTYPALVNGAATIEVQGDRSYRLRADAPGYLASRFFTINGATAREFSFDGLLVDYRALYDSGVNISSQVIFDYSTLKVSITDATSALGFANVFRTLEDYLSTPQGIELPNPPYPIQLTDRSILWFPYDYSTDTVNPVVIHPDPANTSDPELLFETYLEGASDPTYDLYEFIIANNGQVRIIRVSKVTAIAQVAVSGGLSAADRTVIDGIAEDTARVNGLIEDVDGDRFTGKALEAAAVADLAATDAKIDALPQDNALAPSDITTIKDGLSTLSESDIRTAVGLTAANLGDTLGEMKGSGFDGATDSLEALRNRGDSAWSTADGFATPGDVQVTVDGGFTTADRAAVAAAQAAAESTGGRLRESMTLVGQEPDDPITVDASTGRIESASGLGIDVAIDGNTKTYTRRDA